MIYATSYYETSKAPIKMIYDEINVFYVNVLD